MADLEIRFDIKNAPCQSNGDPEVFFADPTDHEKIREAKSLCRQCDSVDRCLSFAIKTNSQGIWGGLTDNERKAYKRRIERANRGKVQS